MGHADFAWTMGPDRYIVFYYSPLYAYFLALVYSVGFQDLVYVRFLNLVMGVGTIVLTYLTARRFLSGFAPLIPVVLLGFCTSPIYYEWFPEKTSLVSFLAALSLYLIARAKRAHNSWSWPLAGFLAGLASLAHMLVLVMLPAVLIYLFFTREETPVPAFKAMAMFAFAFFVGVSPATIHNYFKIRILF